jgi:hypothetical protein
LWLQRRKNGSKVENYRDIAAICMNYILGRRLSSNTLRTWKLIITALSNNIKEAGPALLFARVGLPEEVLLGVAGHLSRRPAGHKVLGDASPVPFPQLPQPFQEFLVLLLSPWYPFTD